MLAREGRPTGFLTSPHFRRWDERVQTVGPVVSRPDFDAAVEVVAGACEEVEAELPDLGHPTQFEVSVAAGFVALAEVGVDVAVIEAGLGGRLDATNVIDSKVTALVSVGIDHTEWLGEDELAIATEKLAVLRPRTTLVTGPLSPEVEALAVETADSLGCDLVQVPDPGEGGFRALNWAVAARVADVLLGRPVSAPALEAALEFPLPGRLELVSRDPDLFFDVAHNRPAARALAGLLDSVTDGRPVVGCFGVAADKDARGMLEEIGPELAAVVTTTPPSVAGSPPGRGVADPVVLARMAADTGLPAEVSAEPVQAIELARQKAREVGGVVLLFGSHSLAGVLGRDR
jgi:dihydrofolate synthase/folylpolyglutamate synthase